MEEKKKLFGRGVYGSKDVPIKILDYFIGGVILTIVLLIIWFASHGGYIVTFETDGGSEVVQVKTGHGELITEPEEPIKAGYEFQKWITSLDESLATDWDFSTDMIENDTILYAVWEPAEILVKFDLDGGSFEGAEQLPDEKVVYLETYGELPEPTKEGYTFDGWIYSGEVIKSDTVVTMTGEHVLTARWI